MFCDFGSLSSLDDIPVCLQQVPQEGKLEKLIVIFILHAG
jgi:hypothetical protein